MLVTSAFPFGLWTAKKSVKVDRNVVAWPLPLTTKPRHQICQRRVDDVAPSTNVAGDDSEVTAIRRYRPGDLMRDVHWSATARLNELMVKERQRAVESHARIVLNVRQCVVSQSGDEPNASLDWAVRVVSGLCDAYFHSRTPVTLHFGQQSFYVRGSRDRTIAMDALALADLSDFTTDLYHTSSGHPRDSQVHILIDANDENAVDQPFAIEVTWPLQGRTARHRIGLIDAASCSLREFQDECQRLSAILNRHHLHQN